MKLARLLAARLLLWLARAADAGLDMLEPFAFRVPLVDGRPSFRIILFAFARLKVSFWRLRLWRIDQ